MPLYPWIQQASVRVTSKGVAEGGRKEGQGLRVHTRIKGNAEDEQGQEKRNGRKQGLGNNGSKATGLQAYVGRSIICEPSIYT